MHPTGQLSAHTMELSGKWALWDNEQWREIQTFDNAPSGVFPTDTTFSSVDDSHVLVTYTDGTARLWDFNPPALVKEWGDGTAVWPIEVSPDGSQVLTGHLTGDVILWNADTGEELLRIPAATYQITDLAFSPDGQSVAITGHDYYGAGLDTFITIWDLTTNQAIHHLDTSPVLFPDDPELAAARFGVWSVSFSPDGRYLFAGSSETACCFDKNGKLVQWDVESGEVVRTLDNGDSGDAHGHMAFINDGKYMVETAPFLSVVDIWDIETGERLVRYDAPEHNGLHSFAILPDEERVILASSFGGPMLLRDLMSGEILLSYIGHQSGIWDVEISPDGTTAISGDLTGNVILWDVESGDMLQRFDEHDDWVFGVAFSPDGQTAYSASLDGRIIKWQVAIPPLDELLQWVRKNRVLREFTPEEREEFGLPPAEEAGLESSRNPVNSYAASFAAFGLVSVGLVVVCRRLRH